MDADQRRPRRRRGGGGGGSGQARDRLRHRPAAPAITVDGEDASAPIRTKEVTAAVSAVSAVPEVRTRITALQRSIAAQAAGGIVVEGRDIGTTVLPDADLKVFLTASPEARAARRSGELKGKEATDVTATREALIKRDAADSGRKTSPLKKADDAVEVDTTELTLEQVVECVVTLVESAAAAKDGRTGDEKAGQISQ